MFETRKVLVEALVAANATIAELRSRNAQLAAHFDWLSAHVNELKLERAALFDKMLGLQLHAVPQITRERPGPPMDWGPQGQVTSLGDILNKAREIVKDERKPPEERESLVGAELGSLSFEDMGDEQAKRAGLTHATDGTVVYP